MIINKLWDLGINKINELHNALLDIDWDFFKKLVKPHLLLQDALWSGQFDKGKLIWFTPTQHIWVRKNKKFILQYWKAKKLEKELEFVEEDIQVPWVRERYFDDDTYDSKQSERSLGGKLDILQTKNKALFHYFVYLYLYTYYHNISVIERISCTNQNNELKTETQDYHKENKTINKLEKFFKSIPESLISYNNQVQEKINKQSELKEYEEIIEIIQNEIKTTDNIEEKKNHLNDFIALKKDHKTIKNEIDSINLNLKNLRQDAQKNLNEAKFSLKQVDKELYRKIKQENYIKSTITRINEDIVDKTINLFNNSIYLASQATKLSVNLLTKGTEKLKNLFTKSKEQPNKTSKKINKDDLVR